MNTKPFNSIYFFLIACILAIACSEEELPYEKSNQAKGKGVNYNEMVDICLPFNLSPNYTTHIVTRAGAKQTGIDSQLSGIMAFVFEDKGDPTGASENLIQFHLFGRPDTGIEGETHKYTPDPNDPSRGTFKMHVPTGDVYIYLIGNAKSSFVYDIMAELQNDPNRNLDTRKEFLDQVIPIWSGNIDAVDGYLPMAGKVNNTTGQCKISKINSTSNLGKITYVNDREAGQPTYTLGGTPYTKDNSFILSRLMSKVTFNFKSGPNVDFIPQTYRFYNCRTVIAPIEEFRSDIQKYGDEVVATNEIPVDAQTPNNFTVYLPENIQSCTQPVTSFAERERVAKGPQGENLFISPGDTLYKFKNAPDKATFIEVFGHVNYLGTSQQSADVRYLFHLGDFSKGQFANYSLERDCHYTYNVTVNGVNDIKVEVLGDTNQQPNEINPSVEGIVFEGGSRVQLDAHFEQIEMYLKQSHFTNGVYIYADTPFGNVHCKYLPGSKDVPGKLDPGYPSTHTQGQIEQLLNWIEFKKQAKINEFVPYSDVKTTEKRMNIFETIDYVFSNQQNEGPYTCFVNEFFYEQHPLGGTLQLADFINVKDRSFSIGSNIKYSQDGRSAVAQAVYMLEQHSIACFYDLADQKTAKYGVELIDETGPLPYGKPNVENTETKNGRENTLKEITDYPAVNWAQNGYLLKNGKYVKSNYQLINTENQGFLACLCRNRDFDGNGLILQDELRWYTPARDQVLGLWIGEPAMPAEAALYPFSTDKLTTNGDGSEYPIYTSTGGEGRVIYAEEGGSFGNLKSANNQGHLRAVRNLGKGDFNTGPAGQKPHLVFPDPFYRYDATTRTIELLLTRNALRGYTSRELLPHHERDIINRPYKKFQVAKAPYIVKNTLYECTHVSNTKIYDKYMTTNAKQAKEGQNIAYQYKEASTAPVAGNALWRLPNQREMLLIVIAINDLLVKELAPYIADIKSGKLAMKYTCKNNWFWHSYQAIPNYMLHCRTSFSNRNFSPLGNIYNLRDGKMQMIWTHNDKEAQNLGMGADGTAGYFCVRDVLVK